jgi:hypothetical protein
MFDRISELDWQLISLIFALISVGFLMLYSAASGSFHPWLIRQMIFVAIFFPVMIFIGVVNIKILYKLAYLPYVFIVILLIVVDIMGHNAMGATRWFRISNLTIQPSEMAKVCLVFALAKYFYNIEAENILKTRYVVVPLIMIAVPAFLIFDQPDLGTATILLMAGVAILFVAGVKMWKFIAVGDSGTVIKTNDGGLHWQQLSTGTKQRLNAIACKHGDCYITGEGGVVLKTGAIITSVNDATIAYGKLKLFPNPSSGSVLASFKAAENQTAFITIHDIHGREVSQLPLENGKAIINGQSLGAGVYSCSLYINNALRETQKLVITN